MTSYHNKYKAKLAKIEAAKKTPKKTTKKEKTEETKSKLVE
jgi:hypothetical protein